MIRGIMFFPTGRRLSFSQQYNIPLKLQLSGPLSTYREPPLKDVINWGIQHTGSEVLSVSGGEPVAIEDNAYERGLVLFYVEELPATRRNTARLWLLGHAPASLAARPKTTAK